MGNSKRPIHLPVPPCSYRVLGVNEKGERSIVDFRAGQRPAAERLAGSLVLVASVVYNSQGAIIFGRMSEEHLEAFRRLFSFESETCSCA